MIGIASPASRGSAHGIKSRYGVEFPNGVDLGGATFALWEVSPLRSFGFVVDEGGKIVYGFDLGYTSRGSRPPELYFAEGAKRFLAGAKDPFGIDEVPAACRDAYAAFKTGQFGLAAVYAKRLLRSSDEKVKAVAGKIIAAADETESRRVGLMEGLAKDGKAGEFHEEMNAFLMAFPRSKHRSKLRTLMSRAKGTAKGRKEYVAASNFQRALGLLKSKKKNALALFQALARQFGETHHGKLADVLATKLR